jgi:hypothetical protein
MRHRLFLAILLCFVAVHASATPAPTAAVPQGLLCRMAIDSAERGSGIPAHLLAAIGRVESGRRDPVTGDWHPWPWTVNAEGEGFFYDTKAQAVAAVRAMQARGVESIDVGCMQVNLMHHPDAFTTLDLAFEPQVNAAYAARFLQDLHARSGDWMKATAAYHSSTPELGADYQRKVLAVWPEESQPGSAASASPLAQAWSATLSAPAPGWMPMPRTQAPGRPQGGRVLLLPATPAGAVPPGRGLAAYRAAPIALAFQPPPRRPHS